MRTNELILYKDMEDGELLQDMTFLMENYNNEYYNEDDMKSLLYSTIGDLTELSVSHGFEGNLWHTYLTYLMVSHENAYSTSCEIVGPVEGSINIAALHDFKIFKELFDYDFQNLGEVLGEDGLAMIRDYKGVNGHGQVFNERIRDRICDLAKALDGTKCAEEFKEKVNDYDIDEDIKVTLLEDLTDSFSDLESGDNIKYKEKYIEMRERYKRRFLDSEEIEDTELTDRDIDDESVIVDVKEI